MADADILDTGAGDMDHLMGLLAGFKASFTISTAANLKLFDLVGDGSTAVSLAEREGWNADCTERLMNALTSLRLLSKDAKSQPPVYTVTGPGKYLMKTDASSIWGVQDTIGRLATSLLGQLPTEIKKGLHKNDAFPEIVSVHKTQEEVKKQEEARGHHSAQHGHCHGPLNEEALFNRYQMFHGTALPHMPAVVKAFDLSKYKTVVDLGGGSGVVSFELARTYPSMEITIFEVPKVVELVKKRFLPTGENLNISFQAGDFLKDDLPQADLYVLSKIVHDWGEEQINVLLTKVFNALNSGGALILLEKCLNDDKDGPVSACVWDMLVMSHHAGRLRSGAEYRDLLTNQHFEDVHIRKTQQKCDYDVIIASKSK